MNEKLRHYENSTTLPASPKEVFTYADSYANFSSHMNELSWMMGGTSMNTHADKKKFQEVGSHLQMEGNGIKLFLDEVVTKREPPFRKEWQTVGDINLLVIGHYCLGFDIKPDNNASKLRVYIDYELPKSLKTLWLGKLFGDFYARWCVDQMTGGVKEHFKLIYGRNMGQD